MKLEGVIGETCEERDSEADVDARHTVNVDHTAEDTAIGESCFELVFHKSGIGCMSCGVVIKKPLWDRRLLSNGFDRPDVCWIHGCLG